METSSDFSQPLPAPSSCGDKHQVLGANEYRAYQGKLVGVKRRMAEGEAEEAANMEQLKMEGTRQSVDFACDSMTGLDGETKDGFAANFNETSKVRNVPNKCILQDVSNKFQLQAASAVKVQRTELDVHRLQQRMKQINFGKNTLGYECYTNRVPRHKRKKRDPQTPHIKQVCSKRSWDGQVRRWRRLLHAYDPPQEDGEEIAEDFHECNPGPSSA